MEDFLTGTFPWVLPHKKGLFSMQQQLQLKPLLLTHIHTTFFHRLDDFMHNRELVDVWQLSIRYKEEIILCKSDMYSFVKSCEFSITSLQHELVQLKQTFDQDSISIEVSIFIQYESTLE